MSPLEEGDIKSYSLDFYIGSTMQGLNIAPALIAIAPTRTVINPIGPLEISDTLVDAQVPLPPQP